MTGMQPSLCVVAGSHAIRLRVRVSGWMKERRPEWLAAIPDSGDYIRKLLSSGVKGQSHTSIVNPAHRSQTVLHKGCGLPNDMHRLYRARVGDCRMWSLCVAACVTEQE